MKFLKLAENGIIAAGDSEDSETMSEEEQDKSVEGFAESLAADDLAMSKQLEDVESSHYAAKGVIDNALESLKAGKKFDKELVQKRMESALSSYQDLVRSIDKVTTRIRSAKNVSEKKLDKAKATKKQKLFEVANLLENKIRMASDKFVVFGREQEILKQRHAYLFDHYDDVPTYHKDYSQYNFEDIKKRRDEEAKETIDITRKERDQGWRKQEPGIALSKNPLGASNNKKLHQAAGDSPNLRSDEANIAFPYPEEKVKTNHAVDSSFDDIEDLMAHEARKMSKKRALYNQDEVYTDPKLGLEDEVDDMAGENPFRDKDSEPGHFTGSKNKTSKKNNKYRYADDDDDRYAHDVAKDDDDREADDDRYADDDDDDDNMKASKKKKLVNSSSKKKVYADNDDDDDDDDSDSKKSEKKIWNQIAALVNKRKADDDDDDDDDDSKKSSKKQNKRAKVNRYADDASDDEDDDEDSKKESEQKRIKRAFAFCERLVKYADDAGFGDYPRTPVGHIADAEDDEDDDNDVKSSKYADDKYADDDRYADDKYADDDRYADDDDDDDDREAKGRPSKKTMGPWHHRHHSDDDDEKKAADDDASDASEVDAGEVEQKAMMANRLYTNKLKRAMDLVQMERFKGLRNSPLQESLIAVFTKDLGINSRKARQLVRRAQLLSMQSDSNDLIREASKYIEEYKNDDQFLKYCDRIAAMNIADDHEIGDEDLKAWQDSEVFMHPDEERDQAIASKNNRSASQENSVDSILNRMGNSLYSTIEGI